MAIYVVMGIGRGVLCMGFRVDDVSVTVGFGGIDSQRQAPLFKRVAAQVKMSRPLRRSGLEAACRDPNSRKHVRSIRRPTPFRHIHGLRQIAIPLQTLLGPRK